MSGTKVLMTLMGMEIGGAETHVLELCKALMKKGLRVYVASNGGAYEPELERCGIVHYKVPLHNRQLGNIVYAYNALKKIIQSNGIRLVHAHGRIPGFLCGLLQKKLRFRFVTTAHGVYSTEFPLNILSDWGEKSLAVSPDVQAYLTGSYKVPAENIRVTVNGIDTEHFSPDTDVSPLLREIPAPGKGDPLRIVSVSRLDADSSTAAKLLAEAAPEIARAFPLAEIYIIGDGEDFAAIAKIAEGVNREAGRKLVTMTGSRTDSNRWLALADVFVGSGRSALEALSAGTPIVATGNSGYLGLITEETLKTAMATNFMYRGCGESTREKLAAGLTALLSKPPRERSALGMVGRAIVKENYSVERMADDAVMVYKAVLKSPWPKQLARRYGSDVVISGYYGYNNSGDDILLQSIIASLKAYKENLNVTVLSMKPKETRRLYGVEAVYRFNFPAVFFKLRRTRLLITGGGSVIQDETSTQSLIYYLWVINTARRLGLKNMLYANGIGPVVKPGNVSRVRRALERVDLITLREDESLRTLREIGVTAPETVVTADAAFALPPADGSSAREYLKTLGMGEGCKFFCVALRSWKHNPARLEKEVARFADHVAEKYGLRALFIPMRPVEDGEISRRVIALMKTPGVLALPAAGDIRGVVGLSEFVLGMRLHALIYAVEKAVPVIGLVYDPKIRRLMDSMRQKFYLPVENADAEKLIHFAETIRENRDGIREKIREAGFAAREKAALNAELCYKLLDMP
ncbi:MAG: polysaccharide pyruvyl transferase CsaB [Clostridiales bacterium]|jgi:polysaccharide pyruvyl transferase CsaB|nr:polysaccharide pyruvyl transferase CsaB [Clostridiales bacterium]